MTDQPALKKLLEIGSPPIVDESAADVVMMQFSAPEPLFDELQRLLRARNGFYAFEGALHFRALQSSDHEEGIVAWNDQDSWRKDYGDLADGLLFFAEDAFGGQFGIAADGVFSFDPETGDRELVADSLEGWAAAILRDYPVLTGHPLAAAWQRDHGPLDSGVRLVPRIPFVCGGAFSVENLVCMDAKAGMRVRASLARQIRDLPDGAQVVFKID